MVKIVHVMFKVLITLSERASAVWTVMCSLACWGNFARSLAFTKASERVQCGRCFRLRACTHGKRQGERQEALYILLCSFHDKRQVHVKNIYIFSRYHDTV